MQSHGLFVLSAYIGKAFFFYSLFTFILRNGLYPWIYNTVYTIICNILYNYIFTNTIFSTLLIVLYSRGKIVYYYSVASNLPLL